MLCKIHLHSLQQVQAHTPIPVPKNYPHFTSKVKKKNHVGKNRQAWEDISGPHSLLESVANTYTRTHLSKVFFVQLILHTCNHGSPPPSPKYF